MTQATHIPGFEWFRYEIGPLEFSTLSTRVIDKIKSYHWTCGNTTRMAYSNTSNTISRTPIQYSEVMSLSIAPQPLLSLGTLSLSNFYAENPAAIILQCYDAMGNLLPDLMQISGYETTTLGVQLYLSKKETNYTGLLLIKVKYNDSSIGNVKVLTIKNQ